MSDMSLSDQGTHAHNAKDRSDQLRRKNVRKRTYQAIVQGLAIVTLGLASTTYAADRLSERQAVAMPSHIAGQKLATPIQQGAHANQLVAIPKRIEVLVRLKGGSVATHRDKSREGRLSRKAQLKVEQADFLRRAGTLAPRSKALVSTQMVLNAVVMEIEADQIDAIASDADVLSVTRVHNYEMDLSETVPYIAISALPPCRRWASMAVASRLRCSIRVLTIPTPTWAAAGP